MHNVASVKGKSRKSMTSRATAARNGSLTSLAYGLATMGIARHAVDGIAAMSDASNHPKFGSAGQPERRSFGRRTMFRHATAMVPGGPRQPCIVIDKSDVGALLKVKELVELPNEFKLILEDDNQVLYCQVVRRNHEHIGVEFVSAPRSDIKIDASMLTSALVKKK
jgi:hypothetical protein